MKFEISATRTADTVTLSLSAAGPTITIKDDQRTERREGTEMYKIECSQDEDGEMVGWCVEKTGCTSMDATTVYIQPKKPCAKKRATQKRTTQKATPAHAEGRA